MTASFTLADLAEIIDRRADADAGQSYTRSLLDAGCERAAKKFGEEAVETIIAAISGDRRAVTLEAADVLYHLLVMLKIAGVSLAEVLIELERRTGQSGHAEKASRRPPSGLQDG
jgi:phosphoribosyl-ATP pyrophosphohydrolase